MTSTLSELELMVSDNTNARSPFKVTDLVWTSLARDFQRIIARDGQVPITNFNNRFASYPVGDRHYKIYGSYLGVTDATDWHAAACQAYYEKLRVRDAHGVLERVTLPLDWDTMLSLEETISLVNADPNIMSDPKIVLDLGSGWGRIGHVLKTMNPKIVYVACDIPESLYVAQQNLPKRLPAEVVHPYSKNREIQRFTRQLLADEGGVRFCGAQHLDRFDDGSVDVFLNAFSFQEMTMLQVSEYFDIIDRVAKGGLFYNQQRLAGDVMTRENYPYFSQWKQLFDRGVFFSPTYFEAAYQI